MKKLILMTAIGVFLAANTDTKASLYEFGNIPEGNPLGTSFSGVYDQANPGATVSGLTVNLSITGGYNGNLYSYLVAPNGTMVVLLDQPGVSVGNPFGWAGSGLDIRLSDLALGSIQTTPETPGSVFGSGLDYRAVGSLSGFDGLTADGTWTLYFADETAGGGQATLNGWSINITTVPEPTSMTLSIFGGVFFAFGVLRIFHKARKACNQPSTKSD